MVVIYFSGTGNTRFIAKQFSKLMKCKGYSIEQNVDFGRIIAESDTIVLCYPIHFSKAPLLFMDFVSKYKDEFRGKKIISLCSQQFFSGDGARSIIDLLEDVEVIYAEHFNMHNNITSMPIYYKLTKRNNERCLKLTYKKLKKVADDVNNNRVKLKGFSEFGKSLGRSQHLSPDSVKNKQMTAVKIRENCVLCEKCVKCCPTQNLSKSIDKIVSDDKCTFCMRCVNLCPKKSISVLLHGDVKEQYFLGNYSTEKK